MQLQFCPLFSSSSGNSIFVGTEKTKILIDAGLSGAKITTELKKIGVNPEELSAILVTHEHSDHISGVGVLSRRYHIPVYANAGTWAAMRNKLGAIEAANVVEFETGGDFSIGDLNIRPFATPHDCDRSGLHPRGLAERGGRVGRAAARSQSRREHARGRTLSL